jgi:outer membrane beta-barrel protein
MINKLLILLLLTTGTAFAVADDIEFPDEELARESVLPVFEHPKSVLHRNIVTSERMELGAGMMLEMNEPYYNDMMVQLQGTYHTNETSAYNTQFLMWGNGLSSYGEQLKAGEGFAPFDASKAPHPKWAVIGNYEYTAYYGKISLSKQSVMNLNLFGVAGLGYLNMDSANTFVINLGLGQNFYFSKSFAIRVDIRWLIFQGPNPASQKLPPGGSAPSADSFDKKIFFNTQMGLSGVFIL